MVNICLLSHSICRNDKRGGLSLFAKFDRHALLRGMQQSDLDQLTRRRNLTTKTRPTCGLMTPPLRTKLTHHSRNIMAMSPPPTNRASRQQLALQHAALLVHDMQEYFITAYDRNVNPMHAALSNIQSSISSANSHGLVRNTTEVLSA